MKGWWYLRDDERVGPLSVETFQELYQDGLVDAATSVWQDGMDQWLPLDQVPELKAAVLSVPPPPPISAADEARLALPDAGRWSRFLARVFDLWWESLVVAVTAGFVLGKLSAEFVAWMNRPLSSEVFLLACLPFALVLDALLYATLGNTPGKALLGLRVTTLRGELLSFPAYLRRNARVWMSGLAFGIPVVSLFTLARQSNRLHQRMQASYDDVGGTRVHARPVGAARRAAFGIMLCVSVALHAGLRFTELERDRQRVDVATQKFYVWTNPETERNALVDARWRLASQTNEFGTRLFIFTELTDRAQVIFGPEEAPGAMLPEYADAFLQGMAGRMQFADRGRYFEEDGLPVWEVEGTMPGRKGSLLSVRIVQVDDVFWRLISVSQPPLEYSSSLADTLKRALWDSVLEEAPKPTT